MAVDPALLSSRRTESWSWWTSSKPWSEVVSHAPAQKEDLGLVHVAKVHEMVKVLEVVVLDVGFHPRPKE